MKELYKKYNDCLSTITAKAKETLGSQLVGVLLSGSLAKKTLVKDWSDLDITIICENSFFATQRRLSKIKKEAESAYNIHIGQYISTSEELASKNIQLGGLKLLLTRQHFHLKLAYFAYLRDSIVPYIYSPTVGEIAKLATPEIYKYHNVLRKTLRDNEGIVLTKMSIKCLFLVTRLAMASMGITCPTYDSVIKQASMAFRDSPFDFKILEKADELRYKILDITDYEAASRELVDFIENFVFWFTNKSTSDTDLLKFLK